MNFFSTFVVAAFSVLMPLRMRSIDKVTARTTLKLWHDLHVERKIAHDFQSVFEPTMESKQFVGGVMNDELKLIAVCTHTTTADLHLQTIAYAPNHESLVDEFLKLLADNNTNFENTENQTQFYGNLQISSKLTNQPRWLLAYTFHKPDARSRQD